jgi:hypothetical protein
VRVVSVALWPESIAVGLTEIVRVGRIDATETTLEVTVAYVPELSVTCSLKFQMPVVYKGTVERVGMSPGVQLNEAPRLV